GGGAGGGGGTGDPVTCADAAAQKSYVGCDYWPTVTANAVWSDFDFAVVIANTGTSAATVTVTGPNNFNQTTMVPASQLSKIYLPWVAMLKRGDFDECTNVTALTSSTTMPHGAYHLVSSVPVVVYQFSALEYGPMGGPAGKDWSACMQKAASCAAGGVQCFSYSNDASLLLPSTALTGNYRVTGWHTNYGTGQFMSITGLADSTTVTVKMSAVGKVLAGTGVAALGAGQTGTYTLNTGDVLQLASRDTAIVGGSDVDPTGTLIKADKPVQVIAGDFCATNPQGAGACDHLEESVFPAETLGKHYLVTAPPGPDGTVVGHTVRLVGNVDGTHLTYNPAMAGAPATLNAGQVVDIGPTPTDFEVTGDHEFAAETIMQGGSVVDPNAPGTMQRGDPSESLFFAVEQYRTGYLFLAPSDYDVNYVVIVAPTTAKLVLDGAAVTVAPTPIGATTYGTFRVPITAGSSSGAHTLTSDLPMGIQVLGYGQYTSYQYPGGGNLALISPVPIG
ncbi:MAG TPA: IgGFc-binding protein, partial [Polyangia bacterium]